MSGPGNLIHLSTTYEKAIGINKSNTVYLNIREKKDGRFIPVWNESI